MKNLLFLLVGLFFFSCSNDDDTDYLEGITRMKYTLLEKGTQNLVYTQEYKFDEEGKVISENYRNYYNEQHNHFSTFEYDELGRVVREIRENKTFTTIIWNGELAEVYNHLNQKTGEFQFDGNQLQSYKVGMHFSTPQSLFLKYNSNNNIISIEDENGSKTEFLNYNKSVQNPLSLIQSIGILRIDYKPFFKNIFQFEKTPPFVGDDFNQPERTYEYHYKLDTQNRVQQIEDDKSLIYTSDFVYSK